MSSESSPYYRALPTLPLKPQPGSKAVFDTQDVLRTLEAKQPPLDSPKSPVSIHHIGASASESTPSQPKDGPSGSASTSSDRETSQLPSPTASATDLRTFAPPQVDAAAIVRRLQQPNGLTGQVAAWAWHQTACLSQTKRSPPVSLIAALWPALHAVVGKMTAQDVLEVMEAWMVLLHAWPRHFRLVDTEALRDFTRYAMPATVKRMSEQRLAQLATLCRDIALHQIDISLSSQPGGHSSASARDLMQPIYALVATETAWRLSNPARYVSAVTTSIVLNASAAWRWVPVRGRDGPSLLALKEATRASLEVLKAHSTLRERAEAAAAVAGEPVMKD